ncbi:ATP-binding protein [Roseicyclus sp. F158]|uniref:histidine kinase n=1 Tax=Tropicimonas omnivorans TaxID=3075590 RepID=A0ABU3DK64_9RHOB|nr:ATP-binding protein [Roseicyclus sp. F158]MDT0684110.1 ATP-binding protein [Roseicyclus sp. F158]
MAALMLLRAVILALAQRDVPDTASLSRLLGNDAVPVFVTRSDGIIALRNPAAEHRFGGKGETLARALRGTVADPSALLSRLSLSIAASGAGREDIVGTRGHLRMAAHEIGGGMTLWRIEDLSEKSGSRSAEGIGLPMMTLGDSGAILFRNAAMRRLVGASARTVDAIFDDLPLQSGAQHNVRTPNGSVRARIVEIGTPNGRREVYLLPAQDDPLGPEEAASLEMLPVAVLRLSQEGHVLGANDLARGLIGPEAGPGANFAELVEGLGRPVNEWLRDAASGLTRGSPEILQSRRGEKKFVQVTLSIPPGTAGLTAVVMDATELKSLEAKFTQSQKMQAIGQLAGGIAHDFNNLLTAILGHCELLLMRHDAGDAEYADLVQIEQNVNRASSLVSQLLAFSRKQTMQPERIDLRDVLSDLVHLLNRIVGERVSLTFAQAEDLASIRADKRQLEQVIMNLVVNARDAMPEGGEICIETEALTLTEPMSRNRATVPAGRYCAVRVKDHGVGIPLDKLEQIFEPFFTTKRAGEGTGLGLATVYGIVKQSGGYVFVDSALGSGTTFLLLFPACAPAEATAPPPLDLTPSEVSSSVEEQMMEARVVEAVEGAIKNISSAADASRTEPDPQELMPAAIPAIDPPQVIHDSLTQSSISSGMMRDGTSRPVPGTDLGKILLVEDEAPVRAFASRALQMRGYEVIEARNAEEALSRLEDPALEIDLFVTDVVMPGLDGPTWVRRALANRPGTGVIFVSGYAEEPFAEERSRIPNSTFLSKPFSLNELTEMVRRQLH